MRMAQIEMVDWAVVKLWVEFMRWRNVLIVVNLADEGEEVGVLSCIFLLLIMVVVFVLKVLIVYACLI